jgi:hypothetical protein
MILSHRLKFIFIKTSKTAGTSIELALEPICGEGDVCAPLRKHPDRKAREAEAGYRARNDRGRFMPRFNPAKPGRQLLADYNDLLKGRRFYNHMSAFEIRARAGRDVFDRYFKFCFERNPWDKMVSAFFWEKDRINVPKDFDAYVAKGRLRSGFDQYAIGGKPAVDFIGRFESLDDDYRKALAKIGIADPPPLPHAKGGFRPRDKSYRDYYTPSSRDAVARQFAREIALLGYEF